MFLGSEIDSKHISQPIKYNTLTINTCEEERLFVCQIMVNEWLKTRGQFLVIVKTQTQPTALLNRV
jgi:hypothetical protein